MKILIDANIIFDVAQLRYPFYEDSALLLKMCQSGQVDGYIALHSISSFYYVFGKGQKDKAKIFIKNILHFITIATPQNKEVLAANEIKMSDLEDSLQIAAALSCNAQYIVTRNCKDFLLSSITAITPNAFNKKIL